jgi:hypothetical protein
MPEKWEAIIQDISPESGSPSEIRSPGVQSALIVAPGIMPFSFSLEKAKLLPERFS